MTKFYSRRAVKIVPTDRADEDGTIQSNPIQALHDLIVFFIRADPR
jgi:hypothetical protein